MFNLTDFKKKSDQIVLKFYETAGLPQVYSYDDLHRQSVLLSTVLKEYVTCMSNESAHFSQNFNVAILLPVHSPALLPAIVG